MFTCFLTRENFTHRFTLVREKNDRWKDHLSSSRIGKNRLKNSVITKIRETGQDIPVMIWQTNMSENDAYSLEIELISRFGRRVDGSGILTNLTIGGEGARSVVHTDEFRERCRQRMLGAGSPTYGVGHTEESRRKMSASQKARCALGKVTRHSEAHRQKLREDNPGGKATAKPVYQIGDDTMIIREWPSASLAAKTLGLSKGNLCAGAGMSSRRKVGGFYWRFVGSKDIVGGKLILPPKPRAKHRRTLIQLSTDRVEIRRWDDIYEAAKMINAKYATLWAAAKYDRPCGGYRWVFL